jgi:hypothetical protein
MLLPADYVLRITHLVSDSAHRIHEVVAYQLVSANQRHHDADENKRVFGIGLTAISSGGRFSEPKI